MDTRTDAAAALVSLRPLMEKVANVHGEHDPRLLKMARLVFAAGESIEVHGALSRIRELTEGYDVPDWACASYRALFEHLRLLDAAAG